MNTHTGECVYCAARMSVPTILLGMARPRCERCGAPSLQDGQRVEAIQSMSRRDGLIDCVARFQAVDCPAVGRPSFR
jgi:hypothetical protein